MRMTSVLIADDHAMVRAGIRRFLEQDHSIQQIGEASTGRDTLEMLSAGGWQLVILDINMPDKSGVDILRSIQASYPDVRVLVVSGYPERQYATNVFKAGAMGFLPKESPPEEILKAVGTVLDGRRYVSAALAELLVDQLDQDADQPPHACLSEREFQIFCKIAAGRSVSEIARELSLSVKTVSTYRARVLEKMHLSTNADLTSYALRNEIIR
jgi:DNA-binding NarL/FixJ family response regulator